MRLLIYLQQIIQLNSFSLTFLSVRIAKSIHIYIGWTRLPFPTYKCSEADDFWKQRRNCSLCDLQISLLSLWNRIAYCNQTWLRAMFVSVSLLKLCHAISAKRWRLYKTKRFRSNHHFDFFPCTNIKRFGRTLQQTTVENIIGNEKWIVMSTFSSY